MKKEIIEHQNDGGRFIFWNYDPDDYIIGFLSAIFVDGKRYAYQELLTKNRFINIYPHDPAKKTMIKNKSDLIKQLKSDGYENDGNNNWYSTKSEISFRSYMWEYAGKEKPHKYIWLPQWIKNIKEHSDD